MVVVVSQAWSKDEGASADGYIAEYEKFLSFHEESPGFLGRRLLRGVEDRTHFTNFRFFATLQAYEDMTERDGYQDHLVAMYEHLRPYESYPREFLEVVVSDGPGTL
jgi:heme-degrading monooxygenase HmoA